MKLFFLSLFLSLPFFSVAADNLDFGPCKWHVTILGGVTEYILRCEGISPPGGGGGGGGGSGDDEGQTNITFSCTNCTAMTPAFCSNLKSNLTLQVSSLHSNIESCQNSANILSAQFSFLENKITVLKQEGDSFFLDTSSDPDNVNSSNLKTWNYLTSATGRPVSNEEFSGLAGNNSIYTYFNNSVKPVLDFAFQEISSYRSATDNLIYNIQNLDSDVDGLGEYVDSLDCSTCQSSQSITLPPGSGDDDGGDVIVSGSCPCSEILGQILSVLQSMRSDANSIKTRLDNWDSRVRNIESDVAAILSEVKLIRNTTDLMDDFFKEDTEFNFKKLIEHTLTLSNAVFTTAIHLPPNLYWQDYTNATTFSSDDGGSFDWLEKGSAVSTPTGDYTIDFGEYSTLNWFQRIEYLLGNIAGIFTPTNSAGDSDFSSEDKANQQLARDQLSQNTFALDDKVSPVRTILERLQSAKSKLNPFSGLFKSYSSQKITLLPNVSLGSQTDFNRLISGQEIPTIELDLANAGNGTYSINDLVSLSHSITTFLWFVFLLLLDLLSFLWFFKFLVKIFEWYHKIGMAWAHSLLTGGAS